MDLKDNALEWGLLPAQAKANDLDLDNILVELSNLNPLEICLISLQIPFMKMVALPCGKQCAIHEPAVRSDSCVYPSHKASVSNPDGSTEVKEALIQRTLHVAVHSTSKGTSNYTVVEIEQPAIQGYRHWASRLWYCHSIYCYSGFKTPDGMLNCVPRHPFPLIFGETIFVEVRNIREIYVKRAPYGS